MQDGHWFRFKAPMGRFSYMMTASLMGAARPSRRAGQVLDDAYCRQHGRQGGATFRATRRACDWVPQEDYLSSIAISARRLRLRHAALHRSAWPAYAIFAGPRKSARPKFSTIDFRQPARYILFAIAARRCFIPRHCRPSFSGDVRPPSSGRAGVAFSIRHAFILRRAAERRDFHTPGRSHRRASMPPPQSQECSAYSAFIRGRRFRRRAILRFHYAFSAAANISRKRFFS